MAVISVNHQN